jgi:hypothetical protein
VAGRKVSASTARCDSLSQSNFSETQSDYLFHLLFIFTPSFHSETIPKSLLDSVSLRRRNTLMIIAKFTAPVPGR